MTPSLKAVSTVTEMIIPEKLLKAIRDTREVTQVALAELGRAHREEKRLRRQYDNACKMLEVAEASTERVLKMSSQVQKNVLSAMDIEDGAWEVDLQAGKLVRTDGQS